jgi:hypothetical protein
LGWEKQEPARTRSGALDEGGTGVVRLQIEAADPHGVAVDDAALRFEATFRGVPLPVGAATQRYA